MSEEIWKDVIDKIDFLEIYQISNKGRIKSLKRKVNSRYGEYKTVPEKILALNKDKNTHYVSITLSLNKKRITRFIHRLVAQAFIPNPENKCCVNHIDGNPTNNNVENLEWVTMSENSKHAYSNSSKRIKTSWSREEVKLLCRQAYKKGIAFTGPEYYSANTEMGKQEDKWIQENL